MNAGAGRREETTNRKGGNNNFAALSVFSCYCADGDVHRSVDKIRAVSRYKSTSSDLVMLQQQQQQQRQRTVYGEELPYVLGVPLDNSNARYSIEEMLFSEAIMNWWCSFAHIG